MKDTRKSKLLSDLADRIHTDEGNRSALKTKSYVRFNQYSPENAPDIETGYHIRDFADPEKSYSVVKGIDNGNGKFVPADEPADIADLNLYGQTVYAKVETPNSTSSKVAVRQAGITLPIGGDNGATPRGNLGSNDRRFLIRENSAELDPSNHDAYYNLTNPNGLTYMIKLKDPALNDNDQSLLMVGSPDASKATFTLEYYGIGLLRANHRASTGTPAQMNIQSLPTTPGAIVTLFVTVGVASGLRATVESYALFDTTTGNKLGGSSSAVTASQQNSLIFIKNPALYIGYGSGGSGPNPDYRVTDFVAGPTIVELAVFDGIMSSSEMEEIANSHVVDQHKSGINSRAPRKTLQMLDAKVSKPQSANPTVPRTDTPAFNDTTTKIFGEAPSTPLVQVYPDSLKSVQILGTHMAHLLTQ